MPIYTEYSENDRYQCQQCTDTIKEHTICVTNELSIISRKWHPQCWIESPEAVRHCCYDYYGRRGSKHKLIARHSHIGFTFDRLWGMDWMAPHLAVKWKDNLIHSWKGNVPSELNHLLQQHRGKMAQIPLEKRIYQMTIEEIRTALEQRKLRADEKENKSLLETRLKRWFQNRWCQKVQRDRVDKVVVMFCRKQTKLYGQSVPIVLQAMIRRYASVVL